MSYRTSTIKRGRTQKLGSSKATIAVSLARKKNDPLYKKMIRYKGLYKDAKKQLERKYAPKSRSLALQKAMNYKYESKNLKMYQQFLVEQEEFAIKELVGT